MPVSMLGAQLGKGHCGVSVSIGPTLRSESLVVQPPRNVFVFLCVCLLCVWGGGLGVG